MKFSEAWLREWVNPDISTDQLADQLSMAGLEVDAVEPAAAKFSGVVVGEVVTREQHPDADKLSVCHVDIGADSLSQIVCGARNVAAGMKVAVATVGAVLPGDFRIKRAKLRGVESLGMICSASELGLAESSDGILPLPADAPVGRDFRDYLNLDDHCIDVDLTPDRADCLSVAGIAREVGVLNRVPLTAPEIPAVVPSIDDQFSVSVHAPAACPRYLCRIVRGIDPLARTPAWMIEKLRRSGVRAISPVVDITNFVLLELGQPMHGFDLGCLQGGIQVRMAAQDETLKLLDGSEARLRDDTLVIADQRRALALAGVMGGDESGVTEVTRDVLLEAAFFAPLAIAGKARSYGLHTDSSHRFERGVDFDLQRQAMERATALLLQIAGGQAGPVNEVASAEHLPARAPITLRRSRVQRLLGISIDDATIADILQRLGMQLQTTDEGWQVVAPSARFDITIEADLIEEIGRVYGYANIPARLGSAPVSVALRPEAEFDLSAAKHLLTHRGYQEAITYSFIAPELCEVFSPQAEPIKLANPISADMSDMRPSLWPGLVQTLKYNLARQQTGVRVFESGLTFARAAGEISQVPKLAGLVFGEAAPEQWALQTRKADFFDIKADLEAVLARVDATDAFRFEAAEHPALHPGQCARVLRRGEPVGWVGLLHPAVQKILDVPAGVLLFEVDLAALRAGSIPRFQSLSKFPAIRRDFALLVDRGLPYQAVLDCIRDAAPPLVKDIQLFDVYTGDNIDSSLKSLALSLILQESSHTLTDSEVEEASRVVLAALAERLSAKLRD
ncbi:MAG TPA: phenylalanine--tRNA ligase subunit beta [Gammaproteobacteria bacterium]|nr:phenylalanine--tRNA ligase subunit beta [Gammaproteobacteria bacterium]HPQ26603.1 phenylalanine--tRNA ligase subunit beta [Gammaproteobacteria bacterium]